MVKIDKRYLGKDLFLKSTQLSNISKGAFFFGLKLKKDESFF